MIYGYTRVSTKDQTHALQHDALTKYGCGKIFSDTISGTKAKRPELDKLLALLQPGDSLIVWKLDRLGRRVSQLYPLIESLTARNIGFVSTTQGFDTKTPMGKAMFGMLCIFAEMEREFISERTLEGLAATRSRGTVLGRRKSIHPEVEKTIIVLSQKQGASVRKIAAALQIDKSLVQRTLMANRRRFL